MAGILSSGEDSEPRIVCKPLISSSLRKNILDSLKEESKYLLTIMRSDSGEKLANPQ
jgi:hypothetical protein